jgi:hypothetical protein
MQCPFTFLGLNPTATVQEIDQRYKQMMLKSHPDKARGSDIISTEQAKLLNEAREKAKELRIVVIKQKAQHFWSNVDRSEPEKYAVCVDRFMMDLSIQEILNSINDLEEEADSRQTSTLCNPGTKIVGYVYGGWNPLFGDLIKIGATTRQPYVRVAELSSFAGVPEPFQLVAAVPSTNPFALEGEIHRHFASVRKYGRKKEFFLLSRSDVIDYFQTLTERAMQLTPKPVKTQNSKISSTQGKFTTKEETESKKRKHVKVFLTDEESDQFRLKVSTFIEDFLTICYDESFVPSLDIWNAFNIMQTSAVKVTEVHFLKELRRQICAKFTNGVSFMRKKHISGYSGLILKQAQTWSVVQTGN